ncbi:putative late blight resistance protein R1B-16 [Capsicum annuum]
MENEGQREKGESNNFVVSFYALCKDVVKVLDFMERLENEEDQNAVDIANQIEKPKLVLTFICMYVQLSHCDLEIFESVMSYSRQEVEDLLRPILDDVDMDHVFPSLMDNIDDCIDSSHHSTSSSTMTDEQLSFLLQNLHYLSKCYAEQIYPLETQYEILLNVCGNMKDFHGLIVNRCIEHEIVQYVLPQFQLMAEKVGIFLWDVIIKEDSHLLICHTNLKASTSAEVGCFIKQLLETSPDIIREYLIHLQEHMVNLTTPRTSGARNIHVMIEFLLIVLTDMPKDFIHHDKLFDLLARGGALIREVSALLRDLEEKSRNEERTNETSRATLDLLEEKIELLKEDLKHVYLKAPDSYKCCFPMNDGLHFMHLLHIHLKDLLDSNSYSIALIKEEIGQVKEDLEFIRSSFVKIEQELNKDLWARVLDVAYEIRLIIEDVSQLPEKIHKNKSLIVVNSPKKPVERKSLTADKIIVGFEEEINWLITRLTSGPKDLDVISITGKTTLAYKVYNDESVSRRFNIRAWCTVGQEYDKRNLLEKVYNQVTGPDSKLSENMDVADELRRHLLGKRYLSVLDDLWDTDTWDKLSRPFTLVENGSRIILTSRDMEVGLYGKRSTDPLNLRLLRLEESWELLEKRAFGNKSCPDELLDVGKEIAENCKGLPLVADLIAGVIAGREKTMSVWLEV